MKRLSNEYYADLLGINLDSIVSITLPNKLDIDPNVHRSKIFITEISYDGEKKKILHKQISNPEYNNAVYHEEVILSASHDLSSKPSNIHYRIPKVLDHRINENILVMEYIEGDSLAQKIIQLDNQYNIIEGELRNNDKTDKEKKLYWEKLNTINEIKKAFIKLALKGLAEFQYYSRENIGYIQKALDKKNNELKLSPKLKLFDPLKHDYKDHYRRKIISNLLELLDTYEIPYDKDRLLDSILKSNPLGKIPIQPLLDEIVRYDSGRVIIADYHPLHIIPMIKDGEVNSDINGIISIEKDKIKKYSDDDLELLIKKITDNGNIAITDLGDVRIGPELFDFVDLTRNHICGLRRNEVDELLQYFLRERQNLRGEDVGLLYAKYHDRFIMIDTYRALRSAVKTEKEFEKIFYLDHLVEDLEYHSELEPLKDAILSYVFSTIERIQQILDDNNGINPNNPTETRITNKIRSKIKTLTAD